MPNCRIVLLSLAFAAPFASAASFNCAQASPQVEKMVCTTPELSRHDDELNAAYKRAIAHVGDKVAVREWQRQWQREWLSSPALKDCTTTECV